MEPKPWYASRTLWFNLAVAAVAAIEAAAAPLAGVIDANVHAWLLAAAAVGNVLLRLSTSQPVSRGARGDAS